MDYGHEDEKILNNLVEALGFTWKKKNLNIIFHNTPLVTYLLSTTDPGGHYRVTISGPVTISNHNFKVAVQSFHTTILMIETPCFQNVSDYSTVWYKLSCNSTLKWTAQKKRESWFKIVTRGV
jgi:hypothetical protein